MIRLYNKIEQQQIKRSAMLIQRAFAYVHEILGPGLLQTELISKVRKFVEVRGGSFCIPDGFPQPFCVCVNDVIAHGLAQDIVFRSGDLVTIDISLQVNGWIADAAWTFAIPTIDPMIQSLIDNAWLITANAIRSIQIGKPLNCIGGTIDNDAHFYGMQVYKEFSGHGVGKRLHEDPKIYHYKNNGRLANTVAKPGMVFTVEPIVTFGTAKSVRDDNTISYRSHDKRPSAQFEHTIAITEDDVSVLSLFGMNAQKLPHLLRYTDIFSLLQVNT